VVGCCGHGDEPSGSSSTELVKRSLISVAVSWIQITDFSGNGVRTTDFLEMYKQLKRKLVAVNTWKHNLNDRKAISSNILHLSLAVEEVWDASLQSDICVNHEIKISLSPHLKFMISKYPFQLPAYPTLWNQTTSSEVEIILGTTAAMRIYPWRNEGQSRYNSLNSRRQEVQKPSALQIS
jgi:hypothetical protein